MTTQQAASHMHTSRLKITSLLPILALLPMLPLSILPLVTPQTVVAQERLPVKRYADAPDWKQLALQLPAEYNFTDKYAPVESSWMWTGNTIHLDRFPNPKANAKIIVLHGIGTNGRLMSLIAAGPLAKLGYETVAPDLLGFGLSQQMVDGTYTYDSWVSMIDSLIQAELSYDNRPIYLLGIGAGGMLAYHVASVNNDVKGIIATSFLDQSNSKVRSQLSQNKALAKLGQPLVNFVGSTKLGSIPFSNAIALNRHAQINNADINKTLAKDPLASGKMLPARFLESYLDYKSDTAPEDFTTCPVLLAQPKQDHYALSNDNHRFLNRLSQIKATQTELRDASHIPVEQTAIEDLSNAVNQFIISTL